MLPTGQEPTVPPGVQETPATPPPAEPAEKAEKFDAAYVKELRAEAAEYRKKLRELEAKTKAEEDAKLTEAEKTQKRLAELEREKTAYEQERQARTVEYEVQLAASRMGIVDTEAAYKLLDLAAIEFNEAGKPTNLDRVLRDLTASKPWLLGKTGSSAANPGTGGTKLTLEEVKHMSEAEINRRWDEVSTVLSRK